MHLYAAENNREEFLAKEASRKAAAGIDRYDTVVGLRTNGVSNDGIPFVMQRAGVTVTTSAALGVLCLRKCWRDPNGARAGGRRRRVCVRGTAVT